MNSHRMDTHLMDTPHLMDTRSDATVAVMQEHQW